MTVVGAAVVVVVYSLLLQVALTSSCKKQNKKKKGLEHNIIKLPRNTYKIEDTRRRTYVVVLFQCFRTANLISIAVIDV